MGILLLDEVVPEVFTKYGGLKAGVFLQNTVTPQETINNPEPYFVKTSGRIL